MNLNTKIILDKITAFFNFFVNYGSNMSSPINGKPLVPLIIFTLFGLFIERAPFVFALDGTNDTTPGEYSNFIASGDITRFEGETLYYDISFLWFENAASAKVKFFKNRGRYYSTLEASTKGFVGFFTSYRKHFYKTEFEIIDGGKKIRPKTFLRQVTIGSQLETTRHFFDYGTRTHNWSVYVNDDKVETGERNIPPDNAFHDILTAFYNVRNSAYGPLSKGNSFKIKTIPEKGHDEISVDIWSEQETEIFRVLEGRERKDEILLNIIVPKEIFKSKTGELLVWSSKHYIPVETTVKDYILLGDLHAKFIRREISLP